MDGIESGAESTETQATEAESTNPAPSSAEAPAQSPASPEAALAGSTPEAAPATPPPYTPNFKYKSYSKEFEMDDWAKSAIKDKETEEKARALYAKAAGLDGVKESLEKYKTEYTPIVEEYKAIKSGIEQVSHFAKTKDFDNFFASLNIPVQNVYEWLERKVEELKQPPHIQQEIAQKREMSRSMLQQQYQYQVMQQQQQEFMRQNQERELDMYSQLPQVASVQSQYEARMGEGTFKKLVTDRIELGRQQGQMLSVADAVSMVSGTLSKFMGLDQGSMQSQPQMANPAQAQSTQPQQTPGKPPVLPNLSSGKGTSPIKAAPKSLDELRALGKQKAQEANA